MECEELLRLLKIKKVAGTLPAGKKIGKISQDTRELAPGDVFVCIEGANSDGHQYVQKAVEKGVILIVARQDVSVSAGEVPVVYVPDTGKAMSILANKFYGFPSFALNVVGVTGTNGKTTVTYIIETVLKKLKKKTALIGTIEMHIADEVIPTLNTTPDNITLQRSFRRMVEKGVEVCAMEVSSQALVKGRVWGVDVDVAVMTNLTHEHMELHKTMEVYKEAKKLLFAQLGNGTASGQPKVAVLNKDDATFDYYAESTAAEVISYSIRDENSDFFAADISYSQSGTAFTLRVNGESYPVTTSMVGQYNVSNTLAALAALYALDYPLKETVQALRSFQGVQGRLELVPNEEDLNVYVDYAHSPDAIENVLKTARQFTRGRLISVFGCAGKREFEKRPLMTRIGLDLSDYAILTTDTTLGEDQDQIWEMMQKGIPAGRTDYAYIEDRTEAIYKALEMARSGDTVLILGRGHDKEYYGPDGRRYLYLDKDAAVNGLERRKLLKQSAGSPIKKKENDDDANSDSY